MTDYHSLRLDSKYVFQLVKREDGSMTKAFISTPRDLCEFLKSQEEVSVEDMYVNFVVDVGSVNEMKPDEDLSLADLVMAVPLLSAHAFLVLMNMNDGALGDLSKYDESVSDSDFRNTVNPEEEENGEA